MMRSPSPEDVPLARRMAPRTLDEVAGQLHLVGEGRLLRRMADGGRMRSLVLFGPPGTGKTSLVRVLAATACLPLVSLNAVSSGVKDLREVIDRATAVGPQLLHVDEVHRFARNQVETLLPAMEDGRVVLAGTTTENPFLTLPPALRSRATILELQPLRQEDVLAVLRRATEDAERGLGHLKLRIDDSLLTELAGSVAGDLRSALNALELAALTRGEGGLVTRELLEDCLRHEMQSFSESDAYDCISALQKSVRGSDPDAALHYLARLVSLRFDLETICRRLVVMAAEDIGNAYPLATTVAVSAARAAVMVGYPEARIPLAQAFAFLASAPKSNAANEGLSRALADVEAGRGLRVPAHLRDSNYAGASSLGRGTGYRYPHDFPGNWVDQDYLPEDLRGKRYYDPTANGTEKAIGERLERLRRRRSSSGD